MGKKKGIVSAFDDNSSPAEADKVTKFAVGDVPAGTPFESIGEPEVAFSNGINDGTVTFAKFKGAGGIVHKATTDLIPYSNNARTHSDGQVAQIAASIKEFGFTNPVLIDKDNGIIAGHGRVMAAAKLGMATVPTICLDYLTEAQRKAYILADNRLAEQAGWDWDLVSTELEALKELDFDISLTGFDDDYIKILPVEGETDPDDVPVVEFPTTVLGDVWLLEGGHRVMCGDSTIQANVEALCAGELVDQLVTDPPYNVDYEGATKDKLKIKNDKFASGDDFYKFLKDAFTSAFTVMKAGAAFYIWHADSEGMNFRKAAADSGLRVRQCLIWVKNTIVMGRQDYHWKHEPCLYGWKEGASHLWNADRKQTTLLEFNKPLKNDIHPTMKPVNLMAYQICNNTKGQDIVLDLFGGSGSTLIAAHQNQRRCFTMEFDPVYVDVIIERWQNFTGKKAILEGSGQTYDQVKEDRKGQKAQ